MSSFEKMAATVVTFFFSKKNYITTFPIISYINQQIFIPYGTMGLGLTGKTVNLAKNVSSFFSALDRFLGIMRILTFSNLNLEETGDP